MDSAKIYFLAVLYLGAHFAFYGICLRRLQLFSRENSVFFYHFFSECAVLVLSCFLAGGREKWAILIGVASLHGIYSLSFLELWALSDGGYSLRILDSILAKNLDGEKVIDLKELKRMGSWKLKERQDSLIRLNLAKHREGSLEITPQGRVVWRILRVFTTICNHRGK